MTAAPPALAATTPRAVASVIVAYGAPEGRGESRRGMRTNEGEIMAEKQAFGRRPSVPLTAALQSGRTLYISGQVPVDAEGRTPEGIEAQTRLVLDRMKALVEEAGGALDDVVKTTVFLKRVEDFGPMNRVYAEYFPGVPPARSTVRADLMSDALLVEIEGIAQL